MHLLASGNELSFLIYSPQTTLLRSTTSNHTRSPGLDVCFVHMYTELLFFNALCSCLLLCVCVCMCVRACMRVCVCGMCVQCMYGCCGLTILRDNIHIHRKSDNEDNTHVQYTHGLCSDSQSSGRGFESRTVHFYYFFFGLYVYII